MRTAWGPTGAASTTRQRDIQLLIFANRWLLSNASTQMLVLTKDLQIVFVLNCYYVYNSYLGTFVNNKWENFISNY
jgi:hypothetical protein